MKQLFISDLHLSEATPKIEALFKQFMVEQAHDADELYVLGDLFEVWIGDDYLEPVALRVIQLFHEFTQAGGKLHFLHGNRDFLLGEEFLAKTGGKIHSDPYLVFLADQSSILMHGDTLCTDDTDYLDFRMTVRDEQWQANFLNKPIYERLAIARDIRAQSMDKQSSDKNSNTDHSIMDVTQTEVNRIMKQTDTTLLIHGHTHRQNRHQFSLQSRIVERIVLGDWGQTGSVLSIEDDNIYLYNFS